MSPSVDDRYSPYSFTAPIPITIMSAELKSAVINGVHDIEGGINPLIDEMGRVLHLTDGRVEIRLREHGAFVVEYKSDERAFLTSGFDLIPLMRELIAFIDT